MDEMKLPVDRTRLLEFSRILQQYKSNKARLERRVIAAENWWKLHNEMEERITTDMAEGGFKSRSAWTHNVIANKHADAMEAYPEPNILPREEGDKAEAKKLSAIIPVVLEQNGFEQTYSDVMWQKAKTGTGIYHIFWDAYKLNGLGDISIERIDMLNIFFQSGVTDIQKSKYIFTTELRDDDDLIAEYPQLKDKLKGNAFEASKFAYDDNVPTEGMTTVIDCYYKQRYQGKTIVHYCKYVGDQILYSTENEAAGYPAQLDLTNYELQQIGAAPQDMQQGSAGMQEAPDLTQGMGAAGIAQNEDFAGNMASPEMPEHEGLYDHGLYPFVFDVLFPIEGSPAGYGYIDLCSNAQTQIDIMQTAMLQNTMFGSSPRYFVRKDGAINEEEFLDLTKNIVHVNGNLGDDSLKVIDYKSLSGNYIEQMQYTINALRETSGNTETATGSTAQGVTAASAIAALQEAAGKGSRDSTKSSYRAYAQVIKQVLELIRQFYDIPRQFRIVGQQGQEQFMTYSNANIVPQDQGMMMGVDMGFRLPEFDFSIKPQKQTAYTKMAQNELAMQLYNMGFFNPQMATMATMCLDMMEFDGKDSLQQKISMNGNLMQMLQQAIMMLSQYDPMAAQQMGGMIGMPVQTGTANGSKPELSEDGDTNKEPTIVANARARAQQASQPT